MGAPRIHGELLKLGIDVCETTVAKYMVKRRGPPSPTWKTFLSMHVDGIAAMDMFVVPTIGFKLLYCLVTLAERLCGAGDRFDPARIYRLHRHFW